MCANNCFVRNSAALEKLPEDVEEDGEGTMHFMVNVVQPQFNLDSEEANVCNFPALFFYHSCYCAVGCNSILPWAMDFVYFLSSSINSFLFCSD